MNTETQDPDYYETKHIRGQLAKEMMKQLNPDRSVFREIAVRNREVARAVAQRDKTLREVVEIMLKQL